MAGEILPAAMEMGDEQDVVVLMLTVPDAVEDRDAVGGREEDRVMNLSTSEVGDWDLPRIVRSSEVRVRASRSRLVERSSYFRGLLGGSFSESASSDVCIRCNFKTVFSVLQCIFDFPVHLAPENYLLLLEGALFFGVDLLLSECEAWLRRMTSTGAGDSLKIPLNTITDIWNYSSERGVAFVSETCSAHLAQNFMRAITSTSFGDLPFELLCSCLEHPDLTVNSEEHLCEALLGWIESNRNSYDCSCDSEEDYESVLSKVRTFLLPLGYSAGRRKNRWFSSIAQVSVKRILDLMKEQPSSLLSLIMDGDSDILNLRLTPYSQKINLSGCVHLTVEILYLAALPRDMEAVYKKRMLQSLVDQGRRCKNIYGFLEKLPGKRSLETVYEVDLSKCSNLHFDALINLLHSSFPSLLVLNLSHCSRFKIEDLFSLLRKCPSLTSVDLTVDICPLILTHASITSASSEQYQTASGVLYSSVRHLPVVSKITNLTLEGRTDLKDLDLLNISALSGSLCYLNLKGCIALTDAGISKLLLICIHLQSLIVSYTYFGTNSVLTLCENEVPSCTPGSLENYEHSSTIAFRLKELQMDGCDGVETRHMKHFFRCLYMLTTLSLCKTSLSDDVLSEYRGSLLEGLDVSETQVSFRALYHLVKRNPSIKMLRAYGCRNFHYSESIMSKSLARESCEDLLFNELNSNYLLEEATFGWGFTSSSLLKLKKAFSGVKFISFGLGASVDISLLPEICPFLETLILRFQIVSDHDLRNILKSLPNLRDLELRCCICDFTSYSLQHSMKNLKSLRLERLTPWMTNADLAVLSENCLNLMQLSLSGCKLLTSDAQQVISTGWPGLTFLHLEDCGSVTSAGISSLLECVAMEDLLLRHSGKGIKKNVISDAASKLPLLRKISLDLCDACEGGFDSPSDRERCSLCIVRIARCKPQRCGFDLGRRPVHKDTIVQVWSSTEVSTVSVEQRV